MKLNDKQQSDLTQLLAYGNGHAQILLERKDNTPEQRFLFNAFRHKFETTIRREIGSVDSVGLKDSNKMFFDFIKEWADGLPNYPKELMTSKNTDYHILANILKSFEKAFHKAWKENEKKDQKNEGPNDPLTIQLNRMDDLKQQRRINKVDD